jgi:3-oxoacyl-[acyl-carrier protein] reductase
MTEEAAKIGDGAHSASRCAVVTGSSSGIGKAIAVRLAGEGWRVIGLDKAEDENCGANFRTVAVDLTDFEQLATALAGIGETDAVVHAAGFMRTAPLGALASDDGTAMWRIHVEAAAVIADTLLPKMPTGGRVASGAAGRSQYAAVKAAMVGMARSWAAELAPKGITVNVVAPAATETPMLGDPARGVTPPKLPPIGRFVRAEEVAALTAFLLGPEASAITGQQIVICGGSSI